MHAVLQKQHTPYLCKHDLLNIVVRIKARFSYTTLVHNESPKKVPTNLLKCLLGRACEILKFCYAVAYVVTFFSFLGRIYVENMIFLNIVKRWRIKV